MRMAIRVPRGQRGVALMLVLGLIVIVGLFMVSISYRHGLSVSRSQAALRQDQTLLLALSAESWARQMLRDDASENRTDSWEDLWAQPIPPLPVEGGILTGCLRDLEGRFNLNNLSVYTAERWDQETASLFASDLDTFLNLLALLELDSSELRAALLIDWMDTDQELLVGGSAEDPDYLFEEPQRMAANQPLVSIEELSAVRGFEQRDVRLLRPFVAALPATTALNVNSASPEVLMALSPVLDSFLVESVLAQRPFASVGDFYQFVSEATGYMTETELREQLPESLIGVSSQFFELLARVDLGGQSVNMRSLIYRGGGQQVDVFLREFQVRPSVNSESEQVIVSSFDCSLPEWLLDEN